MNQTEQAAMIIVWAAAMIASLMWVARDARRRKKGSAVAILCFITFPFGILIWLLLRPSVPPEDSLT
jgi:hypothetical protein